MWSKTKKELDGRLAEPLKKRVRYGFEVYTTRKVKWWTETPVFYIHVDDKLWFATNPMYHSDVYRMHNELMEGCPACMGYWDKFWMTHDEARRISLNESGRLDVGGVLKHLHSFLYEMDIGEALGSGDYMYLVLSVLDRRTGKRRIRSMAERLDEYPEWVRKWITLRTEAEGIRMGVRHDGYG